MSIVLTVLSLGLRVVLSYAFAPHFGMMAIWLAIPAGWLIADIVGFVALGRRGLVPADIGMDSPLCDKFVTPARAPLDESDSALYDGDTQ